MLRLVSHACGTGSAILLDEGSHTWPYIISPNQLQGLSDSEVTREDMVMLVLKNAKLKVLSLGNVSSVVGLQEAVWVSNPPWIQTLA
jgi:hypothetical protein